jgi:hypothetical protein
VDIDRRQNIREQAEKNEMKAKKGIFGPLLQTVFLLFNVIMSKPPRKF